MNPHVKELFDITGKVAIITGGAGWLGSAMSESLAQAGAKVVIVDYNGEAVDSVTSQFKKANLDVSGVVVDATQDKPIRECIDKVAADSGRLDILVNCIINPAPAELDEFTCEDLEKGYRNSIGYSIAAQQAATHMRKNGGGSIIHIGSMYGMVTSYPEVYEGLMSPASVTYSADKAAVIHITHFMAIYWAKHKIRVNCISPGPFPNPQKGMYVNNPKMAEFLKRLKQKTPLGRTGLPWELKGAVLFLASDASSYVTGQNIVVDGGWTVW